MYTKSPKGKNTKGTPSLETYQGRLRIRLRINGQQKAFSLGLADTLENRLRGEAIARQIHLDILSNNFDGTLGKYKPRTHLAFVEPPKAAYLNLGLVLAMPQRGLPFFWIALAIAPKRLQGRTGVAAADWHKKLLEEALEKFNKMSVQQIERFIAEHYS